MRYVLMERAVGAGGRGESVETVICAEAKVNYVKSELYQFAN